MSQDIKQQAFDEDELEINLRDYLLILRKRKGLILLVFIVCVFLAIVKNNKATPYYTAYSQVMIEKSKPNRGLLDYQPSYWDPDFMETQSEIITSVNVGRRVVDSLDLNGRYRHYFFNDTDDEDEAKTSFLSSIKNAIKTPIKKLLDFFSSGEEVEGTGQQDVQGEEIESQPLSDEDIIARTVSGGLDVSVDNAKIVSISYRDKNPAMAQIITNAVVKAYRDEMLEIKLASSSYQLQWMTDKAQQEREKLERAERALQKYMRDNDLVTVENRLSIYPQKLSEFSSQLSRAEADRKDLQALLNQIDAAGRDFDQLEKIPVFAENSVLKSNREEIYRANQKIKELSKKYGPKHPLMIKAKDDVNVLQQEKRFEIQRIVDATGNAHDLAASKEENLKELLSETKTEVLNLNEKHIQYSILKREVESNRLLYDTLQISIKKEDVTEQTQSVNIWVIQEADLPGGPSHPNKSRTLMLAMVLGLFGGIGLAFLIEYLDNTVKSEAELEKRYGRTVLGSVEKLTRKDQNIDSYIVKEPLSPLAESYRLIRSGLLLSSAEKPPGCVLVTSMGKGEGKTATVVNIARVLAQEERKVLIIDCDLRRPRIGKLFNIDNKTGLSNYLSGNVDEPVITPIEEEKISLITSGAVPPNPAELLSSQKMKDLLARLQQQFDFVLLDSPPIQSVTDSLALASVAAGTIVVVQYGKTTYDMMTGGMKKLTDVQANVLGFVINGLKKGEAGAYYYGYSGYYKKYS